WRPKARAGFSRAGKAARGGIRSLSRSRIRRMIFDHRRVVLAIFIRMRNLQVAAFGNGERSQVYGLAVHGYVSGKRVESLLSSPLVKHTQVIVTRWNAGDLECAVLIRYREVRRFQNHDYGAHLGMNVAEHANDAFALERNDPPGAGFVKSHVEDLAVEVREGVVKDWIEIGERNAGAHWNGQHVRREALVLLNHLRGPDRNRRRGAVQRFEPYDDARKIFVFAHHRIA